MSRETRTASIWRSWSWSGSGDACGQGIWSGSGGEPEIASSGSGIYGDRNHFKEKTLEVTNEKKKSGRKSFNTPSPHARRTATPHGRWWRHPARGRKSTRRRAHALSQHSRCSDFLSINLTYKQPPHKTIEHPVAAEAVSACLHDARCSNVVFTSVHVLEGLLGLLRGLKLHISGAPGQVWVESVHWHFHQFDFPICGKYLLNVFLQKNE